MKPEEEIAKKFLEQQELGPLVFEPDGNIPPDFVLLTQKQAFEVRRLNRILSADGALTEEKICIPFWKKLEAVLKTFDGQFNNKSYLVIIDYDTPHPLSKFNGRIISQELEILLDSQDLELPYILTINEGLSLRILELEPIEKHTFVLASWGYDIPNVTDLYINSINMFIFDKSKKIQNYKNKYSEWILLLVDSMRLDLGIDEVRRIKASITDLGLFNALVVIDYEAKLLFEI